MQVSERSNAEQALEPALRREGAMPRKGEARNVRPQVLLGWPVTGGQIPVTEGTSLRSRVAQKRHARF